MRIKCRAKVKHTDGWMCLAVYLLVMCDGVNCRMQTDSIHVSMTLAFRRVASKCHSQYPSVGVAHEMRKCAFSNKIWGKNSSTLCVHGSGPHHASASSQSIDYSFFASHRKRKKSLDKLASIRIDNVVCTRLTSRKSRIICQVHWLRRHLKFHSFYRSRNKTRQLFRVYF